MKSSDKDRVYLFQEAILKLEARRESRIFCFIEGAEEHICAPSLSKIFKCREQFKNLNKLEVLIHSGGGHANIAYQMATFFHRHCKTLNVIVPFEAKSAATLMCLAADKIYLSEFGELGPIDVQVTDHLERGAKPFSPLDEFKSLEFLREYAVETLDYFTALLLERSGMSIKEALHESIPCVTAMMKPMYEKIDPLKFGEHKRLLSEGEEYARRLLHLAKHPNYEEVAARLVEHYPVHDFVINFREASEELDLPVEELDKIDFELLQPVLSMARQGFYGFVNQKKVSQRKVTKRKHVSTGKRANEKRLAVIQEALAEATA